MEGNLPVETPPGAPATSARHGTGSVVQRALHLLDAFQPARPALTLSQLAAHAGVPLSTAHRLLSDLCIWGALERGPDGRYRIGLRIRRLAALAPRGSLLREMCLPAMERLVDRTGCSCVLAVLDGLDAVNIEVLPGTRSAQRVTGQRSHALATAAGRVLVAFGEETTRRDALERPAPTATVETVTDPAALREVLGEVRRAGICVSRRQLDPAFDGVAAPVIDATGVAVAALSLVVPTRALDLPALVQATVAAAAEATRSLHPLGSQDAASDPATDAGAGPGRRSHSA